MNDQLETVLTCMPQPGYPRIVSARTAPSCKRFIPLRAQKNAAALPLSGIDETIILGVNNDGHI